MTQRLQTEASKNAFARVMETYPNYDTEATAVMVSETEKYLDTLQSLKDSEEKSLIKGLVVGFVEGNRMGYIWQIFRKDESTFTSELETLLENASYKFKKGLKDVFPLRINHVKPANLIRLLDSCKKQGIETEVILF